jgi:uncharacterized protein YndB with AHSA1/START domain
MPDIFQDFPIQVSPAHTFQAVSTPEGLDCWWTKKAAGKPALGAHYQLWFGPEYDWRAQVSRCAENHEFELEITRADADWMGTRVGFHLDRKEETTYVRFHHTGWRDVNEHYRVSCHCWALYLRILRRYLEHGEFVPYEKRLDT